MTKNYLGYGYTNNRGVARLQYAPNGEELTHSGYKNNNDYDTDVTAKFTNKTKEYTSNKKHYSAKTDPHINYLFYDNQSTDKTDKYISTTMNVEYIPNEYLHISPKNKIYSQTYINVPIPVSSKKLFMEFEVDAPLIAAYFSDTSSSHGLLWNYSSPPNIKVQQLGGSVIIEDSCANLFLSGEWTKFRMEIDNGVFSYLISRNDEIVYSLSHQFPSSYYGDTLYWGLYNSVNANVRNVILGEMEE